MILLGNLGFAYIMEAVCFIELSELQAESEGGRQQGYTVKQEQLRGLVMSSEEFLVVL